MYVYVLHPSIIDLTKHFTYWHELLVAVAHKGLDNQGSTVVVFVVLVAHTMMQETILSLQPNCCPPNHENQLAKVCTSLEPQKVVQFTSFCFVQIFPYKNQTLKFASKSFLEHICRVITVNLQIFAVIIFRGLNFRGD